MKLFMIAFFCAILIIPLFSCNISPSSTMNEAEKERFIDSFKIAQKVKTDSIVTATIIDTTGVYDSPVKIIKAEMLRSYYKKVVRLKYKNVSNKEISGIRFKWYGLNAFNEPADMSSNYLKGLGGGFTDDILRAGKTTEGDWDIYSNDGKKLVLAWPYEVVFSDGTKWKLNNK